MAKKLQEILANTSQEQFDKEWAEIEAIGFEGPTADEVLEYYTVNQNFSVGYELSSENTTNEFIGIFDYKDAA